MEYTIFQILSIVDKSTTDKFTKKVNALCVSKELPLVFSGKNTTSFHNCFSFDIKSEEDTCFYVPYKINIYYTPTNSRATATYVGEAFIYLNLLEFLRLNLLPKLK
jgi:hypothetical protein